MKLKNAARKFDTCPVYDGYSGALLFRIQTANFLENSAEGTTAKRRVVSADPAYSFPAHKVVMVLNDLIVIGGRTDDEWNGSSIRASYWTKVVTDDFTLLTPGQAALNSAGTRVLGQKEFLKGTVNGTTDSEYDNQWNLYVSTNTVAPKGYIYKSGTTYYRVRHFYDDVDGFRTCVSDEFDSTRVTITFTNTGVYNPITDDYTTASVAVGALLADMSQVYEYRTEADPKYHSGDMAALVSTASITPAVNQGVTIGGQAWRVLKSSPDNDAWLLHLRRA